MPHHLSTISLILLLSLSQGCEDGECSSSGDCDDGVFCNGDESCVAGVCTFSMMRDCDDHIACTIDSCDEQARECVHVPDDNDDDGHFAPSCDGDDCNDEDDTIYPGAEELCDGRDNDCDGVVNEDVDGDDHFSQELCPSGDDCDDNDPSTYLGAEEVCDGVDNNCSGGIDDEADTDGDGSIDMTCGGDDCDDEDPTISPLAEEVCNGLDDDCDDEPDETFDCVMGLLYECETSCLSLGSVECDDHCSLSSDVDDCVPPEEVCNGYDDDCDGLPDNGFTCAFGELTECETRCGSTGSGYCTASCEPPTSDGCQPPLEVCNGADDDCNGLPDDGFTCPAGLEAPCTTICDTTGLGLCQEDCTPAAPEDCTPPAEICNDFIDNDCDLDEDCTDEDCIGDFACGG